MNIVLPEPCLVLLVGVTGSGKSTFARRHFKPTEIVSSDACRALLADDENDQAVTPEAFALLHRIVDGRLRLGRLTVVDATNVQHTSRAPLLAIAKRHDVATVALVFDLPEAVLVERLARRGDRAFGPQVIRAQRLELARSLRGLDREGYRAKHVFDSPEAVAAATLHRARARPDASHDRGPFDIVGDVHGCLDELLELCTALGYAVRGSGDDRTVVHPDGRRLVFVGDLVDRGPDSPGVVRFVRAAIRSGAYAVAGNHDVKLAKALRGRNVQVGHGLERSLEQLAGADANTRAALAAFLESLPLQIALDGGRLVVAHAGLPESLHGRTSARARAFALYGQTTGEVDAFGLPVRYPWADDYRGRATVVYGHTPVASAEWVNNTLCVDTGCVFGGALTALRYPERTLVAVPARHVYYTAARPVEHVAAPGAAAP